MARAEVVIVGAGFYGCCLALFCRSIAERVVIVEARDKPLTRASYVNQARIHTGFHYPRSFATAKRSLSLYRRFMGDFQPAVMDSFRMLYAIAAQGSKVNAHRFFAMYSDMGAPIRKPGRADAALFDPHLIDDVFECDEYAFDSSILADLLMERLEAAGVEVRFGARAEEFSPADDGGVRVTLEGGETLEAPVAFNATYGRLNHIRRVGETDPLPVKNELTEIALVSPPPALKDVGITVMDGPFFSMMPFPARGLHSLTHVRYTPHMAWLDSCDGPETRVPLRSRWLHMVRDTARYVPAVEDAIWRESLFEIKTVLLKNEVDDGRPIFLHAHAGIPGLYSVLGGKLDNVYDLFTALAEVDPQRFARADMRHLTPERRNVAI